MLPYPPVGDLPDPGIEPESLMSPALAGRFFTTSATWEAPLKYYPIYLFAQEFTCYEKMLNVANYKRNENENQNEV